MPKVTRVYRVEFANGDGPYRNNGKQIPHKRPTNSIEDDWDAHPLPWGDGIERTANDFFGFLSLTQLRQWFGGEWFNPKMVGVMYVSIYHVPTKGHNLKVGRTQVAFTRDHAKRVWRRRFEEVVSQ